MTCWRPATGVDLISLEDRLPPSKKIVTAWLPDRGGACYMIVDRCRKRNFKRKPPIIY